MSTTAFVLSGGALSGDFECGALKLLYAYGYRPDVICGTSVGSLNGAKLGEGEGSMQELEAIWRGLKSATQVYQANPQTQGFLDNFSQNAQQIVSFLLENATGLYVFDPLVTLIQQDFNPSLVQSSGIKLRLVSISMMTGETLVINENGAVSRSGFVINSVGVSSSKDYLPNEPPVSTIDPTPMALADAVIASSSVPVVNTPFIDSAANNEYRVDGGIRHILPVNALLDTIGDGNRALPANSSTFAILATPRGEATWNPTPDSSTLGFCTLFKILDRMLLTLVDEITTRDILDLFASSSLNNASVHLIDPQVAVHDPMNIDPDLVVSNMDYGFNRAADVLLGASQPVPASVGLGPNATMADVTNALAGVDIEFCSRSHSSLGSAAPETSSWGHDLTAEAHTLFQNPNYKSNEYAASDLNWALGQIAVVQTLVNTRVGALLPAESLVHELTAQFTDWPFTTNLMAARIGVGRNSLDLGSVPFDSSLPNGVGQVAIGNIGDEPVTVTLALTGQNAAQFLIQPAGGGSASQAQIALGRRTSVLVQIHPHFTQPGDFNAVLSIAGPAGSTITGLPAQVTLHVTVTASPASIVVSPSPLDFGQVAPNSAKQTKVITISNAGSASLSVTLVDIESTTGAVDAGPFMTTPAPGTPAGQLNIGALQSTPVSVTFTPPSTDGSQVRNLRLKTNDPTHGTMLVGLSALVGTKTGKEVEKPLKEIKDKDKAEKLKEKEVGAAMFSSAKLGFSPGPAETASGNANAFIRPEERPDVER